MAASPQKMSRVKLLLLAILFCVVIAALIAVAYHIVRNYRKVQRYDHAVAAFNNKDWQLADQLLKECIQADKNNEEAVAKLAVVCEKLDNWPEAGMLWARAARLNAFKPEYTESMLAAFLKGGNAGWLQSELEKMRPLTSDRHLLLLAFAYGNQGKRREGKAEFEKIKDDEILRSPLGRLTAFYVDANPAMTPRKITELTALAEGNDAAAFYTQMVLADYYLSSGKAAEAEKYLLKAQSFNPVTGALNLAHFYYLTGKAAEAVKLYQEHAKGLAPLGAMRYGEALAAVNQPDEILALAKQYSMGSKQNIQAGYYLEALAAFLKKDDARLAQSLGNLGGGHPNTTTAQMLLLYNGIKQRNPDAALRHFNQLHTMKAGDALKANCANMMKSFVLDLLKANELEAAARVSGRMLEIKEKDVLFTRAVVTNSFRKGILAQPDLESALKLYPNDPGLLAIAADFYLQKGDFVNARKYAEKHLTGTPGSISTQLQIIASMEGEKKIAEAAKAFTELYYKTPEDWKLLTMYLTFCSQHKLTKELANLETFLASNPHANLRLVAHLAGAEKAYAEKNSAKMHEMLMKIVEDPGAATATAENVGLLFRTAGLLGEADYLAPAITVFERLLKFQPDNILFLANQSELYAALGGDKNAATALELARRAYAVDNNSSVAREYYAMRLFENKNYAETERLLFNVAPEGKVSPRVLEAWKISTENMIRELAARNEVLRCTTLCKSLLRVYPDSKLAKDTLNAFELARRKAEQEAKEKEAREAAGKEPAAKTP